MNGGPGWMDENDGRLEPLPSEEGEPQPDPALEAALRQALRPVDPPAGFAERVLARAAEAEAPAPRRARVLAFPGWRMAFSGAVAAALVAGSLLGVDVHQNRERARARAAATAQFETATRITDEALEHTRQELERAGVFEQ